MKRLGFILAALLLFQTSFALQGNPISGKVISAETGEAVPNAKIYFPELQTGVLADAQGNFVFPETQHGIFKAEISGTGYKTGVYLLDLAGGNDKQTTLRLKTDVWKMESFTISPWETESGLLRTQAVTIYPAENENLKSNDDIGDKVGGGYIQAADAGLLSGFENLLKKIF